MARSKAFLLRDRIVAMAKAGTTPKIIAQDLQIDSADVHSAISQARRRGVDIPRFKTRPGEEAIPTVVPTRRPPSSDMLIIPNRLKSLLALEAQRRGKTESELAGIILEHGLLRGMGK